MVHKGKLAQKLLQATTAAGEACEARKKAGNKVVQKYSEIYGHQARQQIALDREDELRVGQYTTTARVSALKEEV
jgi:positive regulator of sigma E activity